MAAELDRLFSHLFVPFVVGLSCREFALEPGDLGGLFLLMLLQFPDSMCKTLVFSILVTQLLLRLLQLLFEVLDESTEAGMNFFRSLYPLELYFTCEPSELCWGHGHISLCHFAIGYVLVSSD